MRKHQISFDDPRLEIAKGQLDIYEFLDSHGVDYVLEGKNVGKNYLGISPCPNCGDEKYHAAIHKENYTITCFKCKCFYSFPKLIAHFKKISVSGALQWLVDTVDSGNMEVDQRVKQILFYDSHKKEKEKTIFAMDELPPNKKITAVDLITNKALDNFLKERRIRPEHIKWYDLRIGTGNYKGKIIFPIYHNNKIVSYQWRTLVYKKYHLPKHASYYLVGEDNYVKNKPVILVEGFLDYLRVDSLLRLKYQNKISCVTGLVKMLSEHQLQRFIDMAPPVIYSMLDSDSWHDYRKIMEKLPIEIVPIILPKTHDPSSLSMRCLDYIIKKEIFRWKKDKKV